MVSKFFIETQCTTDFSSFANLVLEREKGVRGGERGRDQTSI